MVRTVTIHLYLQLQSCSVEYYTQLIDHLNFVRNKVNKHNLKTNKF